MQRWLISIGGLWITASVAWAAGPAGIFNGHLAPRLLELAAETVVTDARPNLLAQPPAAFSESQHYVLQLDGPMSPERRAALEAVGVHVSDYLPSNAYIVGLAQADRLVPRLDDPVGLRAAGLSAIPCGHREPLAGASLDGGDGVPMRRVVDRGAGTHGHPRRPRRDERRAASRR